MPHIDTIEDAPFYIPSLGPSARPRRVLKHGDTFAVLDSHGDIGASAGGPDGLFDHDTRYLSRLELLIDGMQPLLLGSSVRDDNISLSVDLTNPDIFYGGHIVFPRNTIHILRTAYLWNGAAHQRIAVGNFGDAVVTLALSLSFRNDFADLFEVRGQHRQRRGQMQEHMEGESQVAFSYMGLDGAPRRTTLRLEPAPTQLLASGAVYHLKLAARNSRSLFFSAYCDGIRKAPRVPYVSGLIAANRERRSVRSSRGSSRLRTRC